MENSGIEWDEGMEGLDGGFLGMCHDGFMDDPSVGGPGAGKRHKNRECRKGENPSAGLTPKEIKAKLDEAVIGQDDAKKALSVAIYNHYKRISRKKDSGTRLQKSNVLLIGSTGSGKTLLAETLAEIVRVPFAAADASCLTAAGYVGDDVETILLKLIQAADGDISLAQKGIIYIDEIDKLSRKSENPSITRDVSGEEVQHQLLKILEGTIASVPPQGGRKHPLQQTIPIDTSGILFICGGSFEGLDKLVSARSSSHALSIGFGADIMKCWPQESGTGDILKRVTPTDLVQYGLTSELVGRLPVIVPLTSLDRDALVRILTEPRSALIRQYEELLSMDGVKLTVTTDTLKAIADRAIGQGTGARGLRAILEQVMADVMYEAPGSGTKEVVVNRDAVTGEGKPVMLRHGRSKKKAG